MFQIRQELLTTQPSAHGAIDYQELAKQGMQTQPAIQIGTVLPSAKRWLIMRAVHQIVSWWAMARLS